MTEILSPKEALAETCPDCDGTGEASNYMHAYGVRSCGRCSGTGRRTRTTHEPESGIGLEPFELRLRPPSERGLLAKHGERGLRAAVRALHEEKFVWAWNRALEEAAKIAEVEFESQPDSTVAPRIAGRIRGLKRT